MKNPRLYGNPAHHAYFADPFVFRHDGRFFAVGTGEEKNLDADGRIFPMLESSDFITWTPIKHALQAPDNMSLGHTFWAPEIVEREGVYFMYYSAGFEDKMHQLRVALSESPTGPFIDSGDPVLNPDHCSFAIDPNPFQDLEGNWYLYYARDLLDSDRPGTSLVVAPLQDMRTIPNDYSIVARASSDWQRFESDRPMYGSVYDWHTLEGPCTATHEGRYFCLYSGGNWQNDTYGVDYVWSDSPLGPFINDNPTERPRILKTIPKRVIGPGHNSIVLGPNNITQYIAYHAWDSARNARRLFFDVLDWTSKGPRCEGPSWEPRVADW